ENQRYADEFAVHCRSFLRRGGHQYSKQRIIAAAGMFQRVTHDAYEPSDTPCPQCGEVRGVLPPNGVQPDRERAAALCALRMPGWRHLFVACVRYVAALASGG